MKNYRYLVILFGFLTIACSDSDDSNETIKMIDAPYFEPSPVGVKKQAIYDKYGIYLNNNFSKEFFTFDWDTKNTMRYTKADTRFEEQTTDIVQEILALFPEKFIRENMLRTILLVDSMVIRYGSEGNMDDGSVTGYSNMTREGFIAKNYVAIGSVSSRINDDINSLKEDWLSTFIERMVGNWEKPTDFVAIGENRALDSYRTFIMNMPPWMVIDIVKDMALLKYPRGGKMIDIYDATTGMGQTMYNGATWAEDFGNYVAFIIYKTEAEKQLFYNKNAAIKTKVNLVKEYFMKHFKITLPEKK